MVNYYWPTSLHGHLWRTAAERRNERTVQVFLVEILPNGASRKGINASHIPHSASRHSVAWSMEVRVWLEFKLSSSQYCWWCSLLSPVMVSKFSNKQKVTLRISNTRGHWSATVRRDSNLQYPFALLVLYLLIAKGLSVMLCYFNNYFPV